MTHLGLPIKLSIALSFQKKLSFLVSQVKLDSPVKKYGKKIQFKVFWNFIEHVTLLSSFSWNDSYIIYTILTLTNNTGTAWLSPPWPMQKDKYQLSTCSGHQRHVLKGPLTKLTIVHISNLKKTNYFKYSFFYMYMYINNVLVYKFTKYFKVKCNIQQELNAISS